MKNAMFLLDIYQKEKLVDSQKLFHFLFVETMKTLAKLKLMRKNNLGDKEGLQIPCKLHFTEDAKYTD